MSGSIKPQAKLIAALADTMSDNLWADDILNRCDQIQDAIKIIRQIADSRRSGER